MSPAEPHPRDHLAATTLADLLSQMSSEHPGPSAGSAAAVAVGMGAALLAMAARISDGQLPGGDHLAGEAEALRDRALDLGEADAAAVAAMISGHGTAPADASSIPRQIFDAAEQLADLAERLAPQVKANLRADAEAAGTLAESAKTMTAAITRSNE